MSPERVERVDQARWLDDEQQESWRAFSGMMHKLRWALECQLQEDAGLSFIEYHALARLSEIPGTVMRMSELAEVTNASLSRLSHLIKRLEAARPRPPGTRPHRRPVHQRHSDRYRAAATDR